MNKKLPGVLLAALLSLFFLVLPLSAQEEAFYCEVMGIEGTAYLSSGAAQHQALKEGDVLKADDTVEVSKDSSVDLAYDKEWDNITRIEENTKVTVQSIYPINLDMESGGVYAKLKALPRDSTFEVKTPTAVATVRGTEYRTAYQDGQTEVFNFSDSNVYVFGRDSEGNMGEPVIVKYSEATQVLRGGGPSHPIRMREEALHQGEKFRSGIEHKIQEHVSRGHFGKIQDVKGVEKKYHERQWHEKENMPQNARHALVSRKASFGGQKPGKEQILQRQSERLEAIKSADRRAFSSEHGWDKWKKNEGRGGAAPKISENPPHGREQGGKNNAGADRQKQRSNTQGGFHGPRR